MATLSDLHKAQQQSSLGLTQCTTSLRSGMTRLRTVFIVHCTKVVCSRVWCRLCSKEASLRPWNRDHQSGMKSSGGGGGASANFADSKKKGSCGGWCSSCFSVYNFIKFIFICCTGWYTSLCLVQWRSIASSRFVLNMVKGHHLQLRAQPLLFHNFQYFNVKATLAHPVTQKKVQEL